MKKRDWLDRKTQREVASASTQKFRDVDGRSCSDGLLGRRRTELELRSCKPFDEQHWSTAFGAKPSITGAGDGCLCLVLWSRAEQVKAKWQGGGTSAIG